MPVGLLNQTGTIVSPHFTVHISSKKEITSIKPVFHPVMASKLFLASSSLLLLLLLSNIATASTSLFRTQDLKILHHCKGLNSHKGARVGAPARRSSVNKVPSLFSALLRRTRIPPSGPSQRHNERVQCLYCVKPASSVNDISNKQPSRN